MTDMDHSGVDTPATDMTVSASRNDLVSVEEMMITRRTKTSHAVQESSDGSTPISETGQAGVVSKVSNAQHTWNVNHVGQMTVIHNEGGTANFNAPAAPAGGETRQRDQMVKQKSDIQELTEEVKEVKTGIGELREQFSTVDKKNEARLDHFGSKLDTLGKRWATCDDQNKKQVTDLAKHVQIIGDQLKDFKVDLSEGKKYYSSLLKVAQDTKHQVDALHSLENCTETQAKVNEEIGKLRGDTAEAVASINSKLESLSISQEQMKWKAESNTEEAERNKTQLQMRQAEQQQLLLEVTATQQYLQSLVERVETVVERVEHSEDQMKEAVRQLASKQGGGSAMPLSDAFRQNLPVLKNHMKNFTEVTGLLYQNLSITDDDMVELQETRTRDKVQRLVECLNMKHNGFDKLVEALKLTGQLALVDTLK